MAGPEDHIDDHDDDLDALSELKDLLADEGFEGDEDWSPDQLLDELEPEDEVAEADAPPVRRRAGRQSRGRRAEEEQTFRDLDSQLVAAPLAIKVSEDHLTATIGRVGAENTKAEVLEELRRHKVGSGIDGKAIDLALRRAGDGTAQYDVVVARGRPPVVHRPPELRQHLSDSKHTHGPLPLESLHHALAGPSLEVVASWQGQVHVVHKGQVLTDIAPAEFEAGEDVFGAPVEPEFEEAPELLCGENAHLSEDGRAVEAGLYGYAEVLDGEAAVLPPLFVSSDSMEVYFVCLDPKTMPAPSEEEFAEILEARWVEYGVLDDAVSALRQQLDESAQVPRAVLVAEGSPSRAGADGFLEYRFPPADLARWGDLRSLLKVVDRDALATGVEQLRTSGRRVFAVHAGDQVAKRVPAGESEPGIDVRGEGMAVQEGTDVELDVGENVEIDADGLHARATCAGWVAVHGSAQINVVPPLWMARDRLMVCFLNLDQGDPPCVPTDEELAQLVSADPRLEGLSPTAWAVLREQIESGQLIDPVVPIAQGDPPKGGADARFEWAVEVGGRAGQILEDGSIDLRDRRLLTVVAPGDLIGRMHPVLPGTPGRDAMGADIEPPPLIDLEVFTDNRVEAREEGPGVVAYHALAEGGVSCSEETRRQRGRLKHRLRLGLFAIYEIGGDVDYTTGHIDFSGDVDIKGAIKPLFRVRASGTVTVGGNVEPGAHVVAQGDIVVSGGVIGERTRLEAGGSVMAKFVQQASIRAGGGVEVGSYMFEATVRATGQVVVSGKGDGSGRALVGGLVWAGEAIETPSLGSPSNPRTRLVVGLDPNALDQAEALRAKLRACHSRQEEILETLGVRQLDASLLKRKAEAAPTGSRQEVLGQLQQVVQFGLLRRQLRGQLESIAAAQRKLARQAKLTVKGTIFAGPELRVGEHRMKLGEDASQMCYHLVEDDDGQLAIHAEPV